MKLKKLAAGACALALGVSMMAMPAFAGKETHTTSGSSSQEILALGSTKHAYAVDIEWDTYQEFYSRTWNTEILQYDYGSKDWENNNAHVTVTNRSDVTIAVSNTFDSVNGVTIAYSGNSADANIVPVFEGANSMTFDFNITGAPSEYVKAEQDVIKLGTITTNITIPQA